MAGQFCIRVGNNIKKYRTERDLTLKQLAEKVGVTEATMQKYEAGNIKNVSVDMVTAIASALDVRPENITEWGAGEYEKYRSEKRDIEDAKVIEAYNRLTLGNRKAVRNLINDLLKCQERYNSDK